MAHNNKRRTFRLGFVVASTMALIASAYGGVHASTPLKVTGDVGGYSINDSKQKPGGKCAYEGAAGSLQIYAVRTRAVSMFGTTDNQLVEGQLLLQKKTKNGGWKTVQKSIKEHGQASPGSAAVIAPQRILTNPKLVPFNKKYRLVLKLLWLDETFTTPSGKVLLRIDNIRRNFDGSVSKVCPGQKVLV
jgi:hypothetical protein